MNSYTLGKMFWHGFSISDIDLLVKHKIASYGQKSGAITVVTNINEAFNFLDSRRKW